MKLPLSLAASLILFAGTGPGLRADTTLKPDAGGVTLEVPADGKIAADTSLSISFPSAMVGTDKIDLAGEPCPVRFDPPVTGDWLWKSQTDGEFLVKAPVTPGLRCAVRLAPGLRDLLGAAVAPEGWGAELTTEPFTAKSDWESSEHLNARPGVVLKFTYPVRLADAAGRIYFQDRDTAARQPAELALRDEDRDEEPEAATVRATPREPLPVGRTWDLVIEDVREQTSGAPTPYLKRVPLGATTPMTLKWLGAFNQPMEEPVIRAHMDDYLDPASVTRDAVTVEPAVPDLAARAEGEDVVLTGKFDRAKHYQVTITPAVRGRRGFGLAATARWGATFRPKPSAVYFPGSRVSQRAALGLNFSFLQIHTGPLRWRLAAVPLEKLPSVEKRVREFTASKINPVTHNAETDENGLDVPYPTELLVDALGLATRAQGTFTASADETEALRDLRWSGPGNGVPGVPPGAYLLEIDGPRWDGQGTVGQHSLVVFSESVLTEKRTPDGVLVRLAGMSNGKPRPGVPVRAVSASNFEVARGVTDAGGLVRFTYAELHPSVGERGGEAARALVADTPEGPSVGFLDDDSLDEVDLSNDPPAAPGGPALRSLIVTDRSLYRPGQTVRIKGLARLADPALTPGRGESGLRVPGGRVIAWRVRGGDKDEEVAEGKATVDAEGGWEAQWAISPDAKLGDYRLTCDLDGSGAGDGTDGHDSGSVYLHVQDYRVPLFEVAAEALPTSEQDAPVACRVRSNYFSGQPVAGAKVAWRVKWSRRDYLKSPRSDVDDTTGFQRDETPQFQLDDTASEHAGATTNEENDPPQTKGETRLDARGEGTLSAEMPKNLKGARYEGQWEIAVTSTDGQSVAAAHDPEGIVMRQPVLLGVAMETPKREADGPPVPPGVVRLRVAAYDAQDKPARARDAKVELFHVTSKTVRENVAPFVVRYRNTPVFTSVKTIPVGEAAPGAAPLDVPVTQPGRYVAVATAMGLRPVSAEMFVDGVGDDDVPVQTQTSLEIHPEKKEYAPGDTAAFLTRSPVAGLAWVTVETDRVIDNLLVTLAGNTTRVEIPVKPEYAPNAEVSIYLLRPGGGDRLPAERFGHVQLRVRRPDRTLEVHPTVELTRVRPGDEVRGRVRIASVGHPVAGADVTLWAVDDALLALGQWETPDLATAFYPFRPHLVKTYAALRDYVAGISRKSLYQKGFIIGGGGEEFGGKFVRKDFQPLAYWKTGLKTDAEGGVAFAFAAPDNLTRYRVVAVAQTKAGQFGEGEGSVEITKPLIIEPSLPRFLRAGDEVELRAVARQSVHDTENLAATCAVDAGLVLDPAAGTPAPVGVTRDAPAVFRFHAKVPDGPASAKITIRAGVAANTDSDLGDAVELTLPILPPTILRRESAGGPVPAGGDVGALLPPDARKPGVNGHYAAAVSTSNDLPRLRALPEVLEYPHGCFEQITSRVLAYCGARDLLAGLPVEAGQKDPYRAEVERGLRLCARSVLDDGQLPYWPGQKAGNPFVTVQAAWALRQVAGAGLEVDDTLAGKLDGAVKKIAADSAAPGMLRAFALMVQATPNDQPSGGTAAGEEAGTIDEDAARSVCLHRESLGDEGRALLAIALHRAKIMPEEKSQLLREILPLANGSRSAPERAFDARTFASSPRVEAMAVWAFAVVRPPEWKPADAAAARVRLSKQLERATLNSTQENLWTLFAYHAVRKTENAPKLRLARVQPMPGRVSPDGVAAEWTGIALGSPFRVPATEIAPSAGAALSCLLTAEYRVGRAEEDARRDLGGMRLERVARNLTDPKRTGHPGEAPLRINDRLLITYRMQSPKPRAYVALEDELPAGLETLNPELPMFAPFYDLPATPPGQRDAELSSSELRDHVTLLYFDRLDPGVSVWSVLARVSTAGTFHWPATQAGPMYDPSVSGLAPSEQLVVVGD